MKFKDIINAFENSENVLIIIHENPDGDALGSSTALALFLKKIKKNCHILSPSEIPDRLKFILSDKIRYFAGKDDFLKYSKTFDCICTCDVASPQLIEKVKDVIKYPVDVIIDHHKINSLEGVTSYIDENASSCGEIIFSIISEYSEYKKRQHLDKEIASALFSSISSDSGCFKYGNTTSDTHKIASELMKYDINAEEINRLLFDTKTFTQVKVECLAYKKLKLYFDGRMSLIDIDKSELDEISAKDSDTENISQIARMISGVQFGVMMRQKIDNEGKTGYKFSLRSNADIDVSELCAKFGGGGHKKAAGCTIYEDKETALEIFLKEAENFVI